MISEWLAGAWTWLAQWMQASWDEVEGYISVLTMLFTGYAAYAAARAAKATFKGVEASRQAADAAIEANKINQASIVLDHRAWVKIEEIRVAGPLSWSERGLEIKIKYSLRNVGRSPAKNIALRGVIHADHTVRPAHRYRTVAKEHRLWQSEDEGIMFPGDSINLIWTHSLSKSDIEQCEHKVRDDFEIEGPVYLTIDLLVCINYRIVIDNSIHQTGEIVRISKPPGNIAFSRSLGDVSANELFIYRGIGSDRLAD